MTDMINQPPHYTYGDIEVIDIIEMITSQYPSDVAFVIGNSIKYISRANHKNGVEDLNKAVWYLNRAIKKWETEQ
ncbi:TPA: DUF3310 domain-containing protein [Pseudomonas aeruginosa]|nr:DUF3310 domain-containing protein [Pseudomonas aeruginosa]